MVATIRHAATTRRRHHRGTTLLVAGVVSLLLIVVPAGMVMGGYLPSNEAINTPSTLQSTPSASSNNLWSVIHPGDSAAGYFNDAYRGDGGVPMARFAHTMVSIKGGSALLAVNGYMYMYSTTWGDGGGGVSTGVAGRRGGGPGRSATSGPVWMGDLWMYTLSTNQWSRVRTVGSTRPPPSFKLTSALVAPDVVLVVGGDDGGGPVDSYQQGSYASDTYLLNTTSWVWSRGGTLGGLGRQGASVAVVGDAVVVFGGMEAGSPPIYSNRLFITTLHDLLLPTSTQKSPPTWTDATVLCNGRRPPPRRAHGMVSAGGGRAYLFGGHTPDGNLNDLWQLQLTTSEEDPSRLASCVWTLVDSGSEGGKSPPSRGGAGMWYEGGVVGVVGGASCTPGCTCLGDVWVYDVDGRRGGSSWSHIANTGSVFGMRHSFAYAHIPPTNTHADGGLYLFGGESFSPYSYYNDVHRLRTAALPRNTTLPLLLPTPRQGQRFAMPVIRDRENAPRWESPCERLGVDALRMVCTHGTSLSWYDHIVTGDGGSRPLCCLLPHGYNGGWGIVVGGVLVVGGLLAVFMALYMRRKAPRRSHPHSTSLA